jgi:methionine biosynthesis protein MetW
MSDPQDLELIADLVPAGSRVLDLGCGNGELLAHLQQHKGCTGYGIEIADANVLACVQRGVNVVQLNLEEGLALFDDRSFDVVLQLDTLQHLRNTEQMLRETARVGRIGIVSFPNFAHWPNRLRVLRGRMPVTRTLPYQWYDTPNIRVGTFADFEVLARKNGLRILDSFGLQDGRRGAPLAQPARQRGGVQVRRPARCAARCVIVHGLGEHAGRYAHVLAHLAAHGWASLAYDQRGHGRSPGPRGGVPQADSLLADLGAVLAHARATLPGPLVLLGHSLGGLLAARFVAEGLAPPAGGLAAAGGCAGAVVARARPRHVGGPAGCCWPWLGRWRPAWRWATACSRPGSAVTRRWWPPTWPTRWCTTASRRGWCASSSTAGELVRQRAPQWAVPTLLLWAGADRCVAPRRQCRLSPPPRRRHVVQARRFDGWPTRSSTSPSRRPACWPTCRLAGPPSDRCKEPCMNARDPNLPLQADEAAALGAFARQRWDERIVPALTDYIAMPGQEPDVRRRLGRPRPDRPRGARRRAVGRRRARCRA